MRHGRPVVIVSRFFPPSIESQAMYMGDLAADLAAADLPVRVIAEAEPGQCAAAVPGVQVRWLRPLRLGPFRLGKGAFWERGLDALLFAVRVAWATAREAEPGGVVLAVSTPPTAAYVAYAAARLRRAALVWLEYDLHPEIVVAVGGLRAGGATERAWRGARNWLRAHVDAIIVPSEGMARRVRATLPANRTGRTIRTPVHVIHNWADNSVAPVPRAQNAYRREQGVGDALLVLYSGNLGLTQLTPLRTLLDAAARLRDAPVCWHIVGSGASASALAAEVRARGLQDVVRLLPRQPVARFAEIVAAGDIGVIAVDGGAEDLLFPSKMYGILAAGSAVLVLSDGAAELNAIVAARGAGWAVRQDDGATLVALIETLLADPARLDAARLAARATYVQAFGRARSTGAYRAVLEAAGRGDAPHAPAAERPGA